MALLGALTYAEIGVNMPESGGLYAYMHRLHSPFGAFIYLWSFVFFVNAGGSAIRCLMFGRYIVKSMFPSCAVPDLPIRLLATSVACEYITWTELRADRQHAMSKELWTS